MGHGDIKQLFVSFFTVLYILQFICRGCVCGQGGIEDGRILTVFRKTEMNPSVCIDIKHKGSQDNE